jgi:hypothetical protein
MRRGREVGGELGGRGVQPGQSDSGQRGTAEKKKKGKKKRGVSKVQRREVPCKDSKGKAR